MTQLHTESAIPGARPRRAITIRPLLPTLSTHTTMTNRFEARKHNILAQLETPDSEYQDLSPKGSVDEPIRDLIDEINTLDGLVTTSSCSGRISVFLEGRRASDHDAAQEENGESRAGPGGKGGGGAWLFISHEPVEALDADMSSYSSHFGLQQASVSEMSLPETSSRYIHLKFEPMVSSMPAVMVTS
jgi:tRNA wybutosine-synthesizing protein 3